MIDIRSLVAICICAAAEAAAQTAPPSLPDFCPNVYDAMSRAGYPAAAVRKRLGSGEVTISFTVTADDRMTDIIAVEATDPVFEEAAISTVKRLRCKSGGEERHLRLPFSYRLDFGSSSVATRDDIPADRLSDVVPRIAELKVNPQSFALKVGEGVKIDALTVLAYDRDGKLLGRLRQFDRDAQPKHVLAMRGAGIAQASAPGTGFLELTVPMVDPSGRGTERPAVRVEISVSE